ncbi:hypothetical protein WOLCODRAFT_139553 [Wolfiporia cocos MD-104 SS10]|uniref:ASX DEUBAD domain-containing protein n=1 Tax=Wolfiporia cocos (strain MD-104) TaxID=742152 RepID=A0A2H3J4N1_WOLCO|nr:hypothetical protein WOLCODRAFT_139553 [Wolfiporia cocos MD-104 SS10]
MSALSERPRRSVRGPVKAPTTVTTPESPARATGKRKATDNEAGPASKLEYLLTNPKSKLTKMEISDVLNYENFLDLSVQSQELLVALLPPPAFTSYCPSVSPTHVDHCGPESLSGSGPTVDISATTGVDAGPALLPLHDEHAGQEKSIATFDPTTFTSPFFLSAARTFQDHLFSGWFSKKATEEVERFQNGVRDGSLHVEWKDEAWVRIHASQGKHNSATDLTALVRRGLLREGDVLSYRQEFPQLRVVVEKDVLVDSIHPRTNALTVLVPPHKTRSLRADLLVANHPEPEPEDHVQTIEDVTDPGVLEDGILDIDGRVARSARRGTTGLPGGNNYPNGPEVVNDSRQAWKCFTVWRWQGQMSEAGGTQLVLEKGGRERCNTLSYLKSHC